MRISVFFLIFPAIAVLSAHWEEGTETLRSLRKERKSQKSSLISEEKVNMEPSSGSKSSRLGGWGWRIDPENKSHTSTANHRRETVHSAAEPFKLQEEGRKHLKEQGVP